MKEIDERVFFKGVRGFLNFWFVFFVFVWNWVGDLYR